MTKSDDNKFYLAKSFREILASEFSERKLKRSSYSVRSFARDLGINPSTLAGAMQGRYGISTETAKKIALRLRFDEKQKQFFVDLVESQHSRAGFQKKEAAKRLSKQTNLVKIETLPSDEVDVATKWYFFAVLEYVTIHKNNATVPRISKALRLQSSDVERALELLIKHKLVRKSTDGYERLKRHTMVQSNIPSTLIRSFHKQVLDLAKLVLEDQPISNRKFINAVMGFDSKNINEARTWLENAHEDFVSKFSVSPTSDKVYAFGFHLFQLDTGSDQE